MLLALMLASLAACGRKGPLEPANQEKADNPNNPEPRSVENPDTYGDPMTFPEPGEEEASPDPGDEEAPE